MGFTNFPNGVTSLGIPVVGSGGVSIPGANDAGRTGAVWFVNSEAPGGLGSLESPFATIQQAINAAGDGTGDTIYVFPGSYAETLTVTKSALSIIGAILGGYERPDVVPTTGKALTVSTGQGFYCRHMRFYSADSDVVTQNANGFVYDDCVFDGDAGMAANEACLRLVPSATDDSYSASEGIVQNSLFRGATSGAGIIIQHALAAGGGEGTTDNQIIGNRFVGNGADLLSAVNTNGGGAGIFLRTLISGNQFLTSGASYVYINFFAGAAGDLTANNAVISQNWFCDDAIVIGQILIAGQAKVCFVGNFDSAGVINGAAFNN